MGICPVLAALRHGGRGGQARHVILLKIRETIHRPASHCGTREAGALMTHVPNTIKAIFVAAMEIEPLAQRAAYLDRACAGDAALRQRVEALLQAHERTDHFLDQGAVEQFAAQGGPELISDVGEALDFLAPSDKAGSLGRLGHYEVLEVV